MVVLKNQAKVLEQYGFTHSIDNFSEDLSSFSLDRSEPVTITTKETPGFLQTRPKAFTSQAEEIQERIKEHGRSIRKNSVVRQSERPNPQKRKRKEMEDLESDRVEPEDSTEASANEDDGSNHG